MRNPFEGLKPALQYISQEAKVLPATGQAMEDLVRPDHAEVIDTLRLGEERLLEIILETPNKQPYIVVKPISREDKHLFRFFLDGSATTFFIGDAIEGSRRTSIHVSQIGASCIYRKDNGKVNLVKSVHKIILMMNKKAVSFSEKVEELIKKAGYPFEFHDTDEKDGETEFTAPGKDTRSKAPHKAHHLMAMQEEELGRNLKREKDEWLILDGNLGKDLYTWQNIQNYISIAKSFSREPTFKLPGARGGKTINLYELLAELPFSARTCAFSARSGKVLVWYARLREQKQMDYPLMGVVKVEFPNPTGEAVNSEIINLISGALIAERQVTPHGKDIRWHAHIYAIFLAEQAVKNGFVSNEVLRAGLRWPIVATGVTIE